MLTMDVFTQNAFSAIEMTMAVDRAGYVPTTLQSIPGLVTPVPVSTEHIFIEARANAPALIQTSPRGSAPSQKSGDIRDARPFKTRRLARASLITASELQGIRAFASQTELKTLQIEIGRRTMKIKQDFALTKENWLLGMVQGLVTDADGSTIYNWATEFGQTIPAEVGFDLANATLPEGSIRLKCAAIRRTMTKNLQGLGGMGFDIVALCGDQFYDQLTSNAEVLNTYKNWAAAADLRNDLGRAWSAFRYGDINFVNYRGTDDGAIGISTDKAKIFPTGAGIFQWAMAPAETFEFVNTPGRDMYSWVVMDRDRNMWAALEYYSYPLPVCVQPQALASARAGA
ncbi:major capsid protein [Methylocella tundrae]|uniref:major capsid protein n=1 Tax=Methylocella tundrae TaxID=227605 RepID=UPI0030FF1A9E|nr:major capsid protein [Methylocella tundrae]